VGVTGPIVIWGAGAIGGSLGAGFVRAGHEVIFVDNVREHVDAINRHGLQIVGPLLQATVRAKAFLPDELMGSYERMFLCVKALHTETAAKSLAPHLTADGYVVSAQNGLNELVIADVVGRPRTIGCFVNFGADYFEPGVVQYSGRGAVVVGELDGQSSERITALHRLMQDFEPNAVLTENIWGYLWGKLIYGAQLFATALTNDSIADCLADLRFRPVLTALGQEVGAVAKANGVTTEAFNGFDPAAFMPAASQGHIDKSFDDMVAFNRRSAKSHSGIWRDLAIRKRQTEVEPQLGPIVSTAQQVDVPTPLTVRLIEMIVEMEQGKRLFSPDNLTELASAGSPAMANK
jgi:2-dehydropantoate 2-reductase